MVILDEVLSLGEGWQGWEGSFLHVEAAELLEQKNNVTLAGLCTSTPEQRLEELLTLHSLCQKISDVVKLGLD